MERITVFDGEFWAHKNFPPVKDDSVDEFVDCVKELAARLAAYEETGLEPEDMKRAFNEDAVLKLAGQALGMSPDRLRKLAQAEKEGRLVVLPCKVGDTVYRVGASICKWRESNHCDEYCDGWQYRDCWEGTRAVLEEKFSLCDLESISKTVFLTREAAEAALKEREEEYESNV